MQFLRKSYKALKMENEQLIKQNAELSAYYEALFKQVQELKSKEQKPSNQYFG